jgi:DNA-binding transcriptional LysR family regulator
MLDFELLRAFVAVADCGGFHRAAERLNLTQSTISQQIKRLEFETKRPLFRRTTRSVGLTNDGQMLLGDARRLLQLEEAARYRLVAPRLSGRVRLGVVAEVAGGSMPSALGRFATLHPNVKLKVQIGVSAEMIGHLNSGRIDLVFAERPVRTSRGRLVWRDPPVWAAAETFDLVPGAALPLALYRERSVSGDAALAALRNQKVASEIVYTSPSLTGVRAAALAGLVITPASRSTRRRSPMKPHPRSPQLCWRLHKVHRAQRFEMTRRSGLPKSAMDLGPEKAASKGSRPREQVYRTSIATISG